MIRVKLVAITRCIEDDSSPQDLITVAGRICYASEKVGDAEAFVEARIRECHAWILEHANLCFEVRGNSRACSHQLVRHRIASFSQESQRRVGIDDARFVTPPSIWGNPSAKKIFSEAIEDAVGAYERLREIGIRKEDCRFLLPNAAETTLLVTMNVRSLRNFFEVRLGKGAQWEIRGLAEMMLRISYKEVPAAFEDMYTRYIKGKDY